MRVAFLAVLTLAVLGLAGCAGKPGQPSPAHSSTSSSPGESPSSTRSGTPSLSTSASSTSAPSPANHAPVGGLGIVVNGTRATFNLTATDADGDALSWRLAFGDANATNGTALPMTLDHTYLPGNFTVNFTVSDGKQEGTSNGLVHVTAGLPNRPTQVVDTGYLVSTPGCPDPPSTFVFGTPGAGVFWAEWQVEPGTSGDNYEIDVTGGGPIGPVFGLGFYDSGDSLIPGGGTGTVTLGGVVPVGAAHALVMDCLNVDDLTVHYEAGPSVPPPPPA